jgi:hypothetical protein
MEFDSDSTFGGQFLDTISFKVLSPNWCPIDHKPQ